MRDLKNARFIQGFAEELQPDRQLFSVLGLGKSTGNTDSANSRQICSIGENIRQIHLQGIGRFLAQLERRAGRCWRNQSFYFLERVREILPDELAYLLRTQIIGVV